MREPFVKPTATFSSSPFLISAPGRFVLLASGPEPLGPPRSLPRCSPLSRLVVEMVSCDAGEATKVPRRKERYVIKGGMELIWIPVRLLCFLALVVALGMASQYVNPTSGESAFQRVSAGFRRSFS
ncbi:unnamed protein product, partial [Darwinula stevensoni]